MFSHFVGVILPEIVGREYHGPKLVYYAFWIITLLSMGRSIAHICLPDGGAESVASIPLRNFPNTAQNVVIGIFAQWGYSQLLFTFFYLIVLLRYASLIPLMWCFVFVEWFGRLLVGLRKPIKTEKTPPGAIGNIVISVLSGIMILIAVSQH